MRPTKPLGSGWGVPRRRSLAGAPAGEGETVDERGACGTSGVAGTDRTSGTDHSVASPPPTGAMLHGILVGSIDIRRVGAAGARRGKCSTLEARVAAREGDRPRRYVYVTMAARVPSGMIPVLPCGQRRYPPPVRAPKACGRTHLGGPPLAPDDPDDVSGR